MAHFRSEAVGRRRPGALALSTVGALAGAVVTVAALVVGVVLAVIFAATLALVMVLASLLLGLAALAWRAQRRPMVQGALIKGRRAGHAWIAYDWDQPRR